MGWKERLAFLTHLLKELFLEMTDSGHFGGLLISDSVGITSPAHLCHVFPYHQPHGMSNPFQAVFPPILPAMAWCEAPEHQLPVLSWVQVSKSSCLISTPPLPSPNNIPIYGMASPRLAHGACVSSPALFNTPPLQTLP